MKQKKVRKLEKSGIKKDDEVQKIKSFYCLQDDVEANLKVRFGDKKIEYSTEPDEGNIVKVTVKNPAD